MTVTSLNPATKKDADTAASPRRILFVCTGNTCRSPMAAAILNDMAKPRELCSAAPAHTPVNAVAESAGLFATEGAPITPAAADALRTAGIAPLPHNDYTNHKARGVTAEMVDAADAVYGLTAAHAMELTLRFPHAAGKIGTLPMDIPDPYGGSEADYAACLLQLRYCISLLFPGGAT